MKNDVKQHKLYIKVVQNKLCPQYKYIVWDENGDENENFNHFISIGGYNYNPFMLANTSYLNEHARILFTRRNYDFKVQEYEEIRKLSIEEYILVSRLISSINKKFNKKKDILI